MIITRTVQGVLYVDILYENELKKWNVIELDTFLLFTYAISFLY